MGFFDKAFEYGKVFFDEIERFAIKEAQRKAKIKEPYEKLSDNELAKKIKSRNGIALLVLRERGYSDDEIREIIRNL